MRDVYGKTGRKKKTRRRTRSRRSRVACMTRMVVSFVTSGGTTKADGNRKAKVANGGAKAEAKASFAAASARAKARASIGALARKAKAALIRATARKAARPKVSTAVAARHVAERKFNTNGTKFPYGFSSQWPETKRVRGGKMS